ncbi:MAG: gliding motility-associated C-terminal domain-containing protein [Bacteroidota bacterium]
MVKNLFAFLVASLIFSSIQAQAPGNMRVLGDRSGIGLRTNSCGYDAGTVELQTTSGATINSQVLILPFGDTVNVVSTGGVELNGDPELGTNAGIMYLFYECEPSIDSLSLEEISADPCRLDDPFITLPDGSTLPRTDSFWVSTIGDRFGNLTIVNDSSFQIGFNNGQPIQLWFAPSTVDNFATRTFENGGACIDVATDQAFSIIYLNEISVDSVQNSIDSAGCSGSFIVTGGLPQFDSTANYTGRITLNSDPSIEGQFTVNGRIRAGDAVTFFVPQAGEYTITMMDDAGSTFSFPVDMGACNTVTFELPSQNQLPGDNFCVPVTVQNFIDIGAVSFRLNWDPSVINLVDLPIADFNEQMSITIGNFNTNNTPTGNLSFAWFDLALANVTLNNGDTLFVLCFEAVGDLGDEGEINFLPDGTEAQSTVGRIGDTESQVGYNFIDGQINLSADALFVDFDQTNVSCNSVNMGPQNDGLITVRVTQGVPPYNITFTPPVGAPINVTLNAENQTASFPDLPGGDYTIRVEDSNPGMANLVVETLTVVEPVGFTVRVEALNDVSCDGFTDGAVFAEIVSGGVQTGAPTDNFTFTWNIPTAMNTDTLRNLPSGTYAVTVTDVNGCSSMQDEIVDSEPPVVIPDSTVTIGLASCSGVADGSISLRAKLGNNMGGIYIYDWEDFGRDTTVTTSISNVEPGTYRVTVFDDNGCTYTDSVTVGAQKELRIDDTVVDISCNSFGDGSITLEAITVPTFSATPPFTFNWTGAGTENPIETQTTSQVDSLDAGTYEVTMSDADGCSISATYMISEPDTLMVMEDSIVGETCPTGMDGFASVEVTGGTGPYTYQWDDPAMQTDSFASGLVADTLRVIVTDANSCIDSLEVIVGQQAGPQIISFASDSVSCPGDMNGILTVQAQNGNGNITGYSWSNGVSGPNATQIDNLSPGIYTLTITADDGCFTVQDAAVIDPAPLQIDNINDNSPTCPGFANGSLNVVITGGTMPYSYTWNDGEMFDFSLRNGLAAGNYEVTVVDANNCAPLLVSGTVSDPASIVVDFSDILGVDCAEGNCNGEARATARLSDNSTQMFNFNWVSGATAMDTSNLLATGLCAGENTVVVTDESGCTVIDTVLIPSPDSIVLTLSGVDPTCNAFTDGSAAVAAMGGTPGFQFNWTNLGQMQDSVSLLGAGTYTIEVTDANGCIKTDSVTLIEPDVLDLTVDQTLTSDPSCSDTNDGIIAVSINDSSAINPLGPSPFNWSGGIAAGDASIADNLAAGTYAVTVTDVEGCTDTLTITLTQPTPIIFDFPQPPAPLCFGDATVFTIGNISGGAGMNILDYTYSIDNNGLSFTPDQSAQVFAGTRTVTVEDMNGCTAIDTFTVIQPDELSVNFNPAVVEIELGDTVSRLEPTIVSSTPIDSFIWSPSTFLSADNIQNPVVNPLESQDYILRIVDANGCTAQGQVLVELNRARNVFIPNVFSPNGDGRNDELRVYACRGVSAVNYARVFDRWGSLLYQEQNIGIPDCAGGTVLWDGKFNGRDLPAGVYVYIIEVEFIDNVTLVYRGDISIIR